jgi:hypothetical protein
MQVVRVVSGQWSVVSKELRIHLATDHWPLFPALPRFFLASFACSLQRASLVAFTELAARAAALQGVLVRTQTGASVNGQDAFNFRVWTRDDVNTYQFADSARSRCAGVRRRFYRANIAAHKDRHVAGTDVFFPQQHNIRSFDHRVSGFHGSDKTLGLNHSECF